MVLYIDDICYKKPGRSVNPTGSTMRIEEYIAKYIRLVIFYKHEINGPLAK